MFLIPLHECAVDVADEVHYFAAKAHVDILILFAFILRFFAVNASLLIEFDV